MKLLHLTGILVSCCLLFSCGDNADPTKNGSSKSSEKKSESYDGSGFSADVISFDIDKRKTEIEIRNGLDKDIRSIRGYLYFTDSAGAKLTYANGRMKDSPFQKMANPHIIEAKSKGSINLGNSIEKGAVEVHAVISSVETVDGETINFEE